jgi:hypothetical protein
MKTTISGLMLGMMVVGGLIAGGAFMTSAYAQTNLATQSATIGQGNVNTDNDVQTADAILCNVAGIAIAPNGVHIVSCNLD